MLVTYIYKLLHISKRFKVHLFYFSISKWLSPDIDDTEQSMSLQFVSCICFTSHSDRLPDAQFNLVQPHKYTSFATTSKGTATCEVDVIGER